MFDGMVELWLKMQIEYLVWPSKHIQKLWEDLDLDHMHMMMPQI